MASIIFDGQSSSVCCLDLKYSISAALRGGFFIVRNPQAIAGLFIIGALFLVSDSQLFSMLA